MLVLIEFYENYEGKIVVAIKMNGNYILYLLYAGNNGEKLISLFVFIISLYFQSKMYENKMGRIEKRNDSSVNKNKLWKECNINGY